MCIFFKLLKTDSKLNNIVTNYTNFILNPSTFDIQFFQKKKRKKLFFFDKKKKKLLIFNFLLYIKAK